MLKHIFLQELHERYKSGFIPAATLLVTGMLLLSLGMMHLEYQVRLENHSFSKSLDAENYFWGRLWYFDFGDGNVTASDSASAPMPLIRKPEPLMTIARGLDTHMRQGIDYLQSFPLFSVSFAAEQDKNLRKKLFPAPDYLSILNILVSLLAILGSYGLISGLRERGILKMMLSYGASRKDIYLGGYLGSMMSTTLAFTVAYISYVLGLSLILPLELGGEDGLRLLLIYLISLLSIGVFHGIGCLISALNQNSSTALMVGLFFWLLLVFIVPGSATLLAQQISSVDSAETVERTKLETAMNMEREYAEQQGKSSDTSFGGYGQRNEEIQPRIEAELEKIDSEYQRATAFQMHLAQNLARISPTGSVTQIITTLSRTGLVDYRQFMQDLTKRRTALKDYYDQPVMQGEEIEDPAASGFRISPARMEKTRGLFRMIVQTPFRQTPLTTAIYTILFDVLIIATLTVLLVLTGLLALNRYDVR